MIRYVNVGDQSVVTAAHEWVEQSGVAGVVAESVDNEVERKSVDNEVECECSAERLDKLLEALGLPVDKLTKEWSEQLQELVRKYLDVFALSDEELGCTDVVKHVIDTGYHSPIRQQPYRVPVVYQEKISQMIAEMQDQGVIRPSFSPWASPVVLVPKKDGKLRLCVDFRLLNAITKKDVYPLTHINDILDALRKTGYFFVSRLGYGVLAGGVR